jgi:penicillin-binding protein 2
MLRTVAGIGMGGRFQTPHLLKEFRASGAPGDEGYLASVGYGPPRVKTVRLDAEQNALVRSGMWSVVNGPGTAARIRMEGFDIAGKTGTAQVVSLGKDTGKNKDHSWFVSYAPAERPEIAAVALIENVGFGSTFAAPAARAVYDAYYMKTRGAPTEQPPALAANTK